MSQLVAENPAYCQWILRVGEALSVVSIFASLFRGMSADLPSATPMVVPGPVCYVT